MSKLVHLQTQIVTTFGVLDDDGNAIPQEPIVVNVNRFAPDVFAEAQQAIAQRRDEITALQPIEAKAPKPARKPRAQPR